MTTLFISGIDTGIGKTIACGALANSLLKHGYNLFTQKWVETGCDTESQDLLTHQKFVKKKFNSSKLKLHSPYLFKYPSSPHLAAELEQKTINCDYLAAQTKMLESQCDHLLIEGAGGLCVPLTLDTSIIDLVASLNLPIVLVTSGRLGSINHTILSLELCQQRKVEVRAIIFNHYPSEETTILNNTRNYLCDYLVRKLKDTLWLELAEDATELELNISQIRRLLTYKA